MGGWEKDECSHNTHQGGGKDDNVESKNNVLS